VLRDIDVHDGPPARKLRQRPGLRAIAFGASTGGLQPLSTILHMLAGRTLNAPLLVALHTPAQFCETVASTLRRESGRDVVVANGISPIRPDAIHLAPADAHLRVTRLFAQPQAESVEPCEDDRYRPSVDLLFASAAQFYGRDLLAIVLTGMGEDGLAGARKVAECGGRVFTQALSTCAATTMPAAVVAAGLSGAEMSPEELAAQILIRRDAAAHV
jgi:two-component system chemotaxis response regulator CheB